MEFPKKYKALENNMFSSGNFTLVPIRFEDRLKIMQWRNEQIDVLRQNTLLTAEMQDAYFEKVVFNLFNAERPSQILFSFLKNEQIVGYGGLVHIDWKNKNAEISFLLDPSLNSIEFYNVAFESFLDLILEPARNIELHKIYTYGYSLVDYRFFPLINKNFLLEAILKEQVLINENLIDVKIYAKIL